MALRPLSATAVRPSRDLNDTDKPPASSETAAHEHTTRRRSFSRLPRVPDDGGMMAASKSMRELHREAVELEKKLSGPGGPPAPASVHVALEGRRIVDDQLAPPLGDDPGALQDGQEATGRLPR